MEIHLDANLNYTGFRQLYKNAAIILILELTTVKLWQANDLEAEHESRPDIRSSCLDGYTEREMLDAPAL